jgi:hypothetical protein
MVFVLTLLCYVSDLARNGNETALRCLGEMRRRKYTTPDLDTEIAEIIKAAGDTMLLVKLEVLETFTIDDIQAILPLCLKSLLSLDATACGAKAIDEIWSQALRCVVKCGASSISGAAALAVLLDGHWDAASETTRLRLTLAWRRLAVCHPWLAEKYHARFQNINE